MGNPETQYPVISKSEAFREVAYLGLFKRDLQATRAKGILRKACSLSEKGNAHAKWSREHPCSELCFRDSFYYMGKRGRGRERGGGEGGGGGTGGSIKGGEIGQKGLPSS